MKKFHRLLRFSLALAVLLSSTGLTAQPHLNVMTFNIRLDTPRDSANAWPYRKDKVASQILFHQVHILGVQEALHHQMADLQQRLPRHQWTGVARNDGRQKGEYSAIFYDSTRLTLLQGATFWLSENPADTGKAGWDAALPRIATWARFRDKNTGKIFFVFNTHFDHRGEKARAESAKLLLQKIRSLAGGAPVVLMGDFNAEPDSEPIRIISASKNPRLQDARLISRQPHYGPTGTFNGFGLKEQSDQPIDFIFVSSNIQVLQHATLSQAWQGRFASDHFAVFARVRLK